MKYVFFNPKTELYLLVEADNQADVIGKFHKKCIERGQFYSDFNYCGSVIDVRVKLMPIIGEDWTKHYTK